MVRPAGTMRGSTRDNASGCSPSPQAGARCTVRSMGAPTERLVDTNGVRL